jgi:hypothetical protein
VIAVAATRVLAQAAGARAPDPVAATLQYTVAADVLGCPDEAAVRGAVAARIGYATFELPDPVFAVRVVIRGERSELVGELSITPLAGPASSTPATSAPPPGAALRVLRAPEGHCEELLASTATNIAMGLDPSALYGSPAAPAPAPALVVAPAPICPAPPVCPFCGDPELRERPVPKSEPLQLDAAVGGGVTAQALPGIAAHLQLEFGVRTGRFRAAIGGVVTSTTAGSSGSEISAQLTYGTLALCLVQDLGSARFNLAACALGSVGALTGSRPDMGIQSTRVTGALGGRGQAELTLASWSFLRLSIDAQAALTRHLFDIGGAARWSSPPSWLAVQLALGVRFS